MVSRMFFKSSNSGGQSAPGLTYRRERSEGRVVITVFRENPAMRWTAILVACVLGGGGVVTAVQGQEATGRITGVVRLQSGAPVAGANVMLGGTRIGGVAGDDGRYLIAPVPAGRYQLRVSMIGYATVEREVVVGAGATVQADVELQVQALALGEVVVVGYGTRRRAEVTGAVTTVSTSARESAPVQSLDQLLQGTAAGVVVTQASSAPGGGISVRVRGTTSINGNTEPLYVIDGFPIENDIAAASPGNGGREGGIAPSNPLAGLNPADIESLQILKDASATAIYGARGANGVVIITTRSGKVGEGARSRHAERGEALRAAELERAGAGDQRVPDHWQQPGDLQRSVVARSRHGLAG